MIVTQYKRKEIFTLGEDDLNLHIYKLKTQSTSIGN